MSDKAGNAIFVHRIIYGIASAAIKVFIPIIIYSQTNNILLAMLFAMLQYIMGGLLTILLRKFLVNKQAFSMIISILPLLIIQFVLAFCQFDIYIILLLAFLSGISNPLYYIPLNVHFALQDKKHNVAKFQMGAILGKIAFVILSGYILGSTLTNSVVIVSLIAFAVFLISLIPLLINYKSFKKEFLQLPNQPLSLAHNQLKQQNLFHAFLGIFTQALNDILPLYLFYFNLSIEAVSYVVALGEVLKIGTNYLARYLNSKHLNIINYAIGCTIIFVSSIIIMFTTSEVLLFIVGILLGITFPFIFIPSFGNYCKIVTEKNIVADGMILRDFYVLFPRGILFLVYFIIPIFPVLFSLGALSAVGMFVTKIE